MKIQIIVLSFFLFVSVNCFASDKEEMKAILDNFYKSSSAKVSMSMADCNFCESGKIVSFKVKSNSDSAKVLHTLQSNALSFSEYFREKYNIDFFFTVIAIRDGVEVPIIRYTYSVSMDYLDEFVMWE